MEEHSIYPLDVLEFSLEYRGDFIKEHNEEMEYICSSLNHYYDDITHAVDLELSHSVASHLTYNLVLTLAKGLTSLTIYEYMCGAYYLDEDYDSVYEIWKSVKNSAEKILPLVDKLINENYFDEDIEEEMFLSDILSPHCEKLKNKERLLNLHRRVALKTGQSLIYTLICYLRHMEQWLSDLKNGIYKGIEEDYDRVYQANYNLYKQEYWPNDGRNFRSHIENHIPHFEQLSADYLARRLWGEQQDFEHTETGVLWRDYFEDKKDLYFEAKRIKLDEEQWKYFFKSICRFEEYERWIDELRSPQVNEDLQVIPAESDVNPQTDITQKIVAFFTDGTLKEEEPSLLYFLLLAMWARRLLTNKEITAFVRMIGDVYPALYSDERTQEKVIMSLQNMNGKANQYFDEYVTDQLSMVGYIDLMYPKKKNGGRRKDCERAVNLANKLFLALK